MQKIILGLSVVLGFTLTSCKKDVSGCTDPNAISFNSDANVNDNSCTYEGTMSFWYDEDCANTFVYYDVTSLKFYLDGKLIGSKAADTYYATDPGCKNSGVSVTKSLGTVKEKDFYLEVIDSDGDVAWSGDVSIDANTCTSMELTYETLYSTLSKK